MIFTWDDCFQVDQVHDLHLEKFFNILLLGKTKYINADSYSFFWLVSFDQSKWSEWSSWSGCSTVQCGQKLD